MNKPTITGRSSNSTSSPQRLVSQMFLRPFPSPLSPPPSKAKRLCLHSSSSLRRVRITAYFSLCRCSTLEPRNAGRPNTAPANGRKSTPVAGPIRRSRRISCATRGKRHHRSSRPSVSTTVRAWSGWIALARASLCELSNSMITHSIDI